MPDTDSLKTAINAVIQDILPQVVETRHHLHRNPELSGAEAQTAALVAERLRGWGVEDIRIGLAGHGVTGILRGQNNGPMLALRADMDALPVQETSGLPYASCQAGVMHACGHDGHTATLLGAAQALSQLKEHLPGPVKFLFQPAEETTGGADAMIAAGALAGVASIVALHGWPNLEIGQIGYRAGPMMDPAGPRSWTRLAQPRSRRWGSARARSAARRLRRQRPQPRRRRALAPWRFSCAAGRGR